MYSVWVIVHIMLRLQVKNDGSDALFMKEWFAHFKSDSLQICSFHQVFPLYMYALLALCKIWHWKELQERIAPVALLKRGTKSDLLLSLFTKRVKKAIRSMKRVNRYFALKKRAICKKKSEFPTLYCILCIVYIWQSTSRGICSNHDRLGSYAEIQIIFGTV